MDENIKVVEAEETKSFWDKTEKFLDDHYVTVLCVMTGFFMWRIVKCVNGKNRKTLYSKGYDAGWNACMTNMESLLSNITISKF